jgi:hypothetical protein
MLSSTFLDELRHQCAISCRGQYPAVSLSGGVQEQGYILLFIAIDTREKYQRKFHVHGQGLSGGVT